MEKTKTRIMGIDPGLATTGVAILDVTGSSYNPVYCNCIITKKNKPICERLNKIYTSINELVLKYSPNCIAIEEIFFSANVKSAINVGQARGVSIIAGSINNLEVCEYTPLQVKQAVVGYGRATKKQIQYMVKVILGLRNDMKNNFFSEKDDAWDAMAIAICHANSSRFQSKAAKVLTGQES